MKIFSRIFRSTLPLLLLLVSFGNQVFADVDSTREVLESFSDERSEITEAYDRLVFKWEEYGNRYQDHWDLDKLLKAVEFAAEKHEGQVRKDADATPYIIHPMGVAELLWDIGEVRSTNVLIAALLHDTLEDTSATEEEVEGLFGDRVLYTVKEVTNDPSLGSQENKQRQVDHAPTMSLDGQLVKLADRLYNVTDLEQTPPPSWSQEKIDNYRRWGLKLLNGLRGTNQKLEAALETKVVKVPVKEEHIVTETIHLPDDWEDEDIFVLDNGEGYCVRWYIGFYPRVGQKVLTWWDSEDRVPGKYYTRWVALLNDNGDEVQRLDFYAEEGATWFEKQ